MPRPRRSCSNDQGPEPFQGKAFFRLGQWAEIGQCPRSAHGQVPAGVGHDHGGVRAGAGRPARARAQVGRARQGARAGRGRGRRRHGQSWGAHVHDHAGCGVRISSVQVTPCPRPWLVHDGLDRVPVPFRACAGPGLLIRPDPDEEGHEQISARDPPVRTGVEMETFSPALVASLSPVRHGHAAGPYRTCAGLELLL